LLAFEKLGPSLLDSVGVNKILHGRELSAAVNRSVVKPNVDMLYSTLIFDLSENDLAITIPEELSNRFHLFSYYDP
jgi:hypothetical protein